MRLRVYAIAFLFFAIAAAFLGSILRTVEPSSLLSALASHTFLSALFLSLVAAFAGSLISFLPSLLTGYFLARFDFFGKSVLQVLVILPYSVTPVAVGSLVLLFLASDGLGKTLDAALDLLFTIKGAILVQGILSYSIMSDVFAQVFSSIDEEYEELARTMGYGRLSTLFRILTPMARKGIVEGYLLGFLKAFTDFGATVMVAGAIIGKTATIPISIYILMNSGDVSGALSLIVVSFLISALLTYSIRASGYMRRRENVG